MTAAPATARTEPTEQWSMLAARCPRLASTMRSYLEQQALTLAPRTIYAADGALRRFGLWLTDHDPAVVGAADIGRAHIEAFKIHCHTTTTSTREVVGDELDPSTAAVVEGVLRSDHRMGLGGCSGQESDHPRRRPTTARADAQVPRRRRHGRVPPPRHHRSLIRSDGWSCCCWPGPGCASPSSATCHPIRSS